MTAFKLVESMYCPNKLTVQIDDTKLPIFISKGSRMVICARLLGLSWVHFLQYCRDHCGATLIGKNYLYPMVFFENNKETKELIALLNDRAERILKERKNG